MNLREVLRKTMNVQDVVYDFMSSYFRNLLPGRMGEDTIPFMLLADESSGDYFEAIGYFYRPGTRGVTVFETHFFRIEDVHEKEGTITISLLIPLDVDGEITTSVCEVYKLKKTKCCLTLCLNKFCGIQFVDPRLVTRNLPVVEPKW
ncbi:CotY/CotZ family spore coat protein [Bacillus pinisoli]|uniref:CotY/CotZ family spore coat protein n=1 Tax=Bacillus pinisoli TaxID=2901866 RepID=UPI001FF4CA40|nr:CotY/CotZ family spore coat protein [Bacillus pinisoli]